MVMIFLSSFYNSFNQYQEQCLNVGIDIIIKSHNQGLTPEEIKGVVDNELFRVETYSSYNDIDPELRKMIHDDLYTSLDSGEVISIEQGIDTYKLFKLDNSFFLITTIATYNALSIRLAVIISALIMMSVGGFVIFLGIGTFIRPIINMSEAARKVAEGDYSVQLPTQDNKDAIGQLIDDFNQMCRMLLDTEMMHNDFITSISHEFRTPIQSIYGYANLLKDEVQTPEHKEFLKRICEESERLSSLSANILRLNRLDNLDVVDKSRSYRLDEQIRQTILMLENKWMEKKIEWDINLERLTLNADQDLMKQVFINLFDNALKFSPPGSTVEVNLHTINGEKVFSIKDHGKGIEEKDMEKIFDKFFKSDRSRKTPGNGLGLSIVKKILDMHGYKITAENIENGGAEFKIIF
jgi:signal transduction histidine kinase